MGNANAKPKEVQEPQTVIHVAPSVKPPPSVVQFHLYSHRKIMEQLNTSLIHAPLDLFRIIGGYVAPNVRLAFCKSSEIVIYHLEADVQETRPIMDGQWIGWLSDNVVCVRGPSPRYECTWLDAKTLDVTSTSSPGEKLFEDWLILGEGEQARWLHFEGQTSNPNRKIKFSRGPNDKNPLWYTSCVPPQELPDGRVVMAYYFALKDKDKWTCQFCECQSGWGEVLCMNCSRSRPPGLAPEQENKDALWTCTVCQQNNINPQVTECPRCLAPRNRRQEVRLCVYEMAGGRECLSPVDAWAVDTSLAYIALFPAHIATLNLEGDIKVWTVPRAGECSRLLRRWSHPEPDCTLTALPAERVAVANFRSIAIFDVETGQQVKDLDQGGRGLCVLPEANM